VRLKYAALVIIGDIMSEFFNLISYVLTKVFMDLNNPFTYIFGLFFGLGLIVILKMFVLGDK